MPAKVNSKKQAAVSDMDPAHEQGHKKMNLKAEFSKDTGKKTRTQGLAGLEAVTRAENIQRKERSQRRVFNSGK